LHTPKNACKILGVHIDTLRNWDKQGLIDTYRTEGGHRRYLITRDGKPVYPETIKQEEGWRRDYIYCRVSSNHQKKDLERQIKYMQEKYPRAEVVSDIGSGLNFKRKGLLSLVDKALEGTVGTLHVSHKDRLCRFGFELLHNIFNKCGSNIVVIEKEIISPE
jgi:predicted site-specific integrase-resolvase